MKLITTDLFGKLGHDASSTPRLRKNYNFHQHEDAVQRFLNVLQPESYVCPHQHRGEENFEFYVVLQGSVGLILFSERGEVTASHRVSAIGNIRGVEIPGNTYHTIVCLEPNTVILEVKEGPYDPNTMKYSLAGFPSELDYLQALPGSPEKKKYTDIIANWKKLFV